jgi:DNA-binding response OmpR family regulator
MAGVLMDGAARAVERPAPRATERRVLIVDPEASGAALASRLAECGYEASMTGSVSDARTLLADQPFAALVTDLALPEGGRRWLAELRAARPRMSLLVVAAEPIEGLGLDRVYGLADAVLAKPAEPRLLTAMLDRMMDCRSES